MVTGVTLMSGSSRRVGPACRTIDRDVSPLHGIARAAAAAVLAAATLAVPLPVHAEDPMPRPGSGDSRRATRRTFVYGGVKDFAPYEYLDTNGQPRGFSIDLVR